MSPISSLLMMVQVLNTSNWKGPALHADVDTDNTSVLKGLQKSYIVHF